MALLRADVFSQRLRALVAQVEGRVGEPDAILAVDDAAAPKKGEHSVTVAPRYATMLGNNTGGLMTVPLTLTLAFGCVIVLRPAEV